MLEKFPGMLGYGGIIAIHADWPIYPTGIGWEIALKSLGNFPQGSRFYEVDDIDRCKLLTNEELKPNVDYYHEKHYHLAIWHSDLIELKKQGLIEGIVEQSDHEFELEKFEKFKKYLEGNLKEDNDGNIILHTKDEKGKLHEVKYYKPLLEEEEEEELAFKNCVSLSDSITLTSEGLNKLAELAQGIDYSQNLKILIEPLLSIQRYDTAIRDASLLIETNIKTFYKSNLFGQKLIDFHIEDIIRNNDNFNSAAIKCYRGELRTIFRYIRNDFAHNFKVISETQCKVILKRINDTLIEFNEVINAYYK